MRFTTVPATVSRAREQLLKMAMIVANFTGGEAEELRRAMGFKRSEQRMQVIESKLRLGMTQNAIVPDVQNRIVQAITSFALYGFRSRMQLASA
jgi:error-prone DNA polymerase